MSAGVKLVGDVRQYKGVRLGEGTVVEGPAVLGFPPRGKAEGELELVIGPGAVIRPFTTIYAGTTIGEGFQTGQCVSIREENRIGDAVSIGSNCTIEPWNIIGHRTRIHSGCVMESTTLGEDVWVAPYVVFSDCLHPPCPEYQRCVGGVVVEDQVKIGTGALFMPGIRIGRGALVAAGAVVTRDVPPGTVVVGNPARITKRVSELACCKGFFPHAYARPPYEDAASTEEDKTS